MEKIVVYLATPEVFKYLNVSIYSLLLNNPNLDKIYCLVTTDNTAELVHNNKIEYINIQNTIKLFREDLHPHFPSIVDTKVLIPELFPTFERVLIIDTDTIIDGSLEELFATNIDNYYFAAVRDIQNRYNGLYYNAGILYLNMDQLRFGNIPQRALKMLTTNFYEYPEQDVLNILCRGMIKTLDSKFNSGAATEFSESPIIHHFAGFPKKEDAPNYSITYKYLRRMEYEKIRNN